MSDPLQVERTGDRLVLTLSNPDLRNALSEDMATALIETLADVDPDDLRCVVLEGAGGTFCAGGDVEAMLEGVAMDDVTEEMIEEKAEPTNRAVQAVYECPLPTVATVDGPAVGAGGALAIACDVVLASEGATIGFGFRQVGLSVDSGTSALLPRQVGESVALDLVYTGDLVDAERAHDLGLFTRVFPDEAFEERASEVIEEIASGPTAALRRSKRLIRQGARRDIGEAIDHELEALVHSLGTADHEDGVRAFMEGRDPEFVGE